MELVQINHRQERNNTSLADGSKHSATELRVPSERNKYKINPFIEANTKEVSLSHLRQDNLIPVFAKDNERTIAHQEFIEIAQECVGNVFNHQQIDIPEIRVSHEIKGRTSDAIHKSAKELLEHEKTQYFERMAFVIRIPQ